MYDVWKECSQYGSHSTIHALGLHFAETDDPPMLETHYFVIDQELLQLQIFNLLNLTYMLEEFFFKLFVARLQLDPDLQRKRNAAKFVMQSIKETQIPGVCAAIEKRTAKQR